MQNIHPHEKPGERQAGLAPRIRARTDGATPASWLLKQAAPPNNHLKPIIYKALHDSQISFNEF